MKTYTVSESKEILKNAAKSAKTWLVKHRRTIAAFCVVAGAAAVFGPDVLAAESESVAGFEKLQEPMKKFKDFMVGPVPKAIGTMGIGMVGASWAFNIENQITKAGLRLFGGTAAGLGATSLVGIAGTFLVR